MTTIISPAESVKQLALAAKAFLLGLMDSHVAGLLNHWPESLSSSPAPTSRELPVLQWFPPPPDSDDGPRNALLSLLHQVQTSLFWSQTYSADDFGPEFLLKYGWTELIGLRGAIPSDKIACGFLLLGPEIEYPSHYHTAEEVYIVLAGTASWRRGKEPWHKQPPGTVIHHPSNMPHSMCTHEEALLALYIWHNGYLAQQSIIA